MRTVVIGAGMAGIAAAIQLRDAGFDDLTLYEKADRLGGTWRENTYPGIACDVPSHLYSYSFAPNAEWSHTFSPGAEIQAYLEAVAHRYGVDRSIVFGSEISRLEWDGRAWNLTTVGGQQDRAEVVIAATGVLHHPRVPELPGLSDFAGPVFHSARWDHGVEIDGRRWGVIGTGSSAVQITGAVVDRVAELQLFQRTAQWILAVPNQSIAIEEKSRFREDPEAMTVLRKELAQSFVDGFANAVVDADSWQMRRLEDLCRANLEENVTDPDLRERLRPDYRAACKRLVVSPNFYQAIQRPNARLVTSTIERIEPPGIRTADGELHELDVIVLATGFRVDRFLRPIEVAGADGLTLDQVWAARPSAYLSVAVPGFPNLFMLNGPNGPVGNFSLIDVAEMQIGYIRQLIEHLSSGSARSIVARGAAAERFETERVDAAQRTIWVTGCRSWYLDDRGIPAVWPWSFDRFRQVMETPDLADYEVA